MPRGKTQRSLDLIQTCYDILAQIQPASVRAVCYQLFIRHLIPSMAKTCTNRVSTQLVYARKEGLIPWEWIVDETRDDAAPGTWDDPETFIPAVMAGYRRDRWVQQTHRIEVWSEKGTVRGTLAALLDAYGVQFRICHGFTSWTKIHDAARLYRADPKPTIILYVGDYDPSGLYMSEVDIVERLRWEDEDAWLQETVTVVRLAILADDAAQDGLPSFPATDKQGDSRYGWFVERYGASCWELDAMNPNELRQLVQAEIEEYIDWEEWLRCDAVEAAERRSLETILGTWKQVIAGQATI
jgi:hypothetical protein